MHRTLALSAALLLAATAANAGYLERVPNTPSGHYIPSQEEQESAYRRQMLESQYRQEQELERIRRSQPHCVQRALPNGQLYSFCD